MTDQAPPPPPDEILDSTFNSSELIKQYVDILLDRGIAHGLIGPREADRIWDRHVLNSAALSPLVPDGSDVADVGSGAGLPGIPVALARPDLRLTLIEPLLRRYTFLVDVVAELGIGDRVTVVRARAEDHKATYDIVTARAVAPLDRLVKWCAPLLAPGGALLAFKGDRAEQELADAGAVLAGARLDAEVLEIRAHAEADPTRVVRLGRRS